jgi:hypothetical protein
LIELLLQPAGHLHLQPKEVVHSMEHDLVVAHDLLNKSKWVRCQVKAGVLKNERVWCFYLSELVLSKELCLW